MTLIAILAVSAFVFIVVFQPKLTIRRQPHAAQTGCSETTCLLSYVRPRFNRGPGARLRFTRSRRNLMLASYGWAEPTGPSRVS